MNREEIRAFFESKLDEAIHSMVAEVETATETEAWNEPLVIFGIDEATENLIESLMKLF